MRRGVLGSRHYSFSFQSAWLMRLSRAHSMAGPGHAGGTPLDLARGARHHKAEDALLKLGAGSGAHGGRPQGGQLTSSRRAHNFFHTLCAAVLIPLLAGCCADPAPAIAAPNQSQATSRRGMAGQMMRGSACTAAWRSSSSARRARRSPRPSRRRSSRVHLRRPPMLQPTRLLRRCWLRRSSGSSRR